MCVGQKTDVEIGRRKFMGCKLLCPDNLITNGENVGVNYSDERVSFKFP
jgi:hypothetical protein